MTFTNPFNVRLMICAAVLLVACATVEAQVGGNGTPGKIAKFKSPNSVGDSVLTEDKFGKVGVGTDAPTSKLTVAGMIESLSGGIKFSDGTIQTTAGVSSIFHDQTLAGNGTTGSPLGIATGGVGTNQLADNAVTAGNIASGQVVKGLNGLTDQVTLAAGPNVTLTPDGNILTIASTVKDPALSAFQKEVFLEFNPNVAFVSAQISVPANKRLVIEYISIRASVTPGRIFESSLSTRVNGDLANYRILAVKVLENAPTNIFEVDKQVRIYADGGTSVSLFVDTNNTGNTGNVHIEISGHLVDLP